MNKLVITTKTTEIDLSSMNEDQIINILKQVSEGMPEAQTQVISADTLAQPEESKKNEEAAPVVSNVVSLPEQPKASGKKNRGRGYVRHFSLKSGAQLDRLRGNYAMMIKSIASGKNTVDKILKANPKFEKGWVQHELSRAKNSGLIDVTMQ